MRPRSWWTNEIRLALGSGVEGLPGHADIAAVRPVDAGEDLDQGRFAGAVGTEKGVDLAAQHREIDDAERLGAAEALGQALHGEDRFACVGNGRERGKDRPHIPRPTAFR